MLQELVSCKEQRVLNLLLSLYSFSFIVRVVLQELVSYNMLQHLQHVAYIIFIYIYIYIYIYILYRYV